MRHPRSLLSRRAVSLLFLALAVTGAPVAARAGCNLIPPAEQAFPSTVGSIVSPVTTAGESVELRLTVCDGSPGFDATPANNQVAITFVPAGPGQPAPILVAGGAITVDGCSGGTCDRLRFTMPASAGLAGPAAITVTVGPTTVADIGPLFQAQTIGDTCDKMPETVFQQFTIMAPPNDFGTGAAGALPEIVATLDGSGSLLIPFDYRSVLPLGPGEPVARLVSGTTSLDAFPGTPGLQTIDVPTSYVRSFTVDGRPLPPLIRATDGGNAVFGSTDAAVAVIRVARDGSDGVKFDLASARTSSGYGPIVIPSSDFTLSSTSAIPLENLRSTATGVAFTRDEALEGNLNGGSGDADVADHIVQLIDVGGFVATNTAMAASATRNPVVGGAALDVGPTLAAFLESEAAQNAADLNGDGDALDDVLRVFTVAGTELTPAPTLLGNPFPGVNRRPLAIAGTLVYYREPLLGLDASPSFGGDYDMAISPDGRYLYSVGSPGIIAGFFNAYHLDPQTGGAQRDIEVAFSQVGLDGATGLDVSADSRFVFVAVKDLNLLECLEAQYDPSGRVILRRPFAPPPDGGGGRLTQGIGGVDGLTGATDVAASPDGTHAYVVADGDDAVTAAAVDPAHGALSFVATIKNGIGVADMADPVRVAVSADGQNVYVAAHGSSAIQVFSRNPATGVLTPLQSLVDGAGGGPSLGGIADLAVSADGANVYATADTDSALNVFSRNPGTGALTFVTAITNGVGGVTDLDQGKGVAVSPDGTAVYATTAFGHLLVFTRAMPGGGLTYVESVGPNFGAPLDTGYLAVTPDSEHVYQQFSALGFTAAYTRRGALRAFDTQTTSLRPGLAGANGATLAAVSGGRAAFTTSGGTGPVQLYDAATDGVTQVGTGVPASKLALSATLLAMIVPEGALGKDGNKDGDTGDDVVVLASPANPAAELKTLPIHAEEVGVTDLCRAGGNDGQACTSDADCPGGMCRGLVVIATNEWRYKDNGEDPHPPQADFNGNGVVEDLLVLFVYDTATKKLVNLGWQAYDFVVSGRLVAFRTDEAQRLENLNGDEDPGADTDIVMMIYDLATGAFINPAAAVVKCEIPGCEPGLPYKIKGGTVVFLVPEPDQERDLDGDGLVTHTVVVSYDTGSAVTQVLSTTDPVGTLQQPALPITPPLLPTTFTAGDILYKQVHESDIGKDVNEDGDLDDVVTLVEGDSDGDGVFDNADVCSETSDPDQRDSDGDSLPDVCDPNPYCAVLVPAAPPTPPADTLPCQKAIGKATRQLLAAEEKATRGCLDQIAKGKLAGDPTTLCRGGISNASTTIVPGEPKTGARFSKAIAKAGAAIAKACSPAVLLQLTACATSPEDVAGCVAETTARGAAIVSSAGYGEVGLVSDPGALTCQVAIGKAAGKHLDTVTKTMLACVDKLQAGKLTGSADTLCLGAGTESGFTAPTDPATAAKLQKAADQLTAGIAAACPGAVPTMLDGCGDDAASLAGCLQCANGRQALFAVRAGYGPQ